ncbi:MAG: MFS transporter [Dethiobacteria bacterium]|nr:MFS transporter [Dethiobacteria bacterium]
MKKVKQLPLWGKIAYGAGAGGFSLIDRVLITWLFYYYITSPLEGVDALMPPFLFGMIMFVGRVIDALADPLIARWSDNYKGRLGRRMPFMLFSGVAYAAVFALLFYPPVAGISVMNSIYVAVLLSIYFILFTAYVCPYLALLPELARCTRDRVDLATYKAVFSLLGVGIALIGAGILIGMLGFHGMVWAMAGVGVVLLYLPMLIKEKDYADAKPATLGLAEAIGTTFKNRAFLIYLIGNVTFWLGFNIVTLNIPLYVTILLRGTEDDTSIYFGLAFVVALLFFPVVNILAKKLGLKAMMMFALIAFLILLPCFYFLGQSFFGLSSEMLAYILMGVTGLPLAVIFIVPDAIVAAVSDLEEKLSGQRREAMYFGAQGFILKLALGLSTVITGALLQFFGSSVANPLGIQLTGPVSAIFILIGVIVFRRYPEKEVQDFERKLVG